jgi:hypothetical protein
VLLLLRGGVVGVGVASRVLLVVEVGFLYFVVGVGFLMGE